MPEPLTPEALAADFDRIASWMATRPNGVTWTGDGLDGTVAGLRDAAKSIREHLVPAHAALAAGLQLARRTYFELQAELQEIHDLLVAAYGREDLSEDTPAVVAGLIGERDKLAKQLADAEEDYKDLHDRLDAWPQCPDGCGCDLATGDADAQECGCDGPCTMECRENGYPDAPSYRDLAVRHVTDDLTEAKALIDALREDNHGIARAARYEATLERIHNECTTIVAARKVAREALEGGHDV